MMMRIKNSLFLQVILALILGLIVGVIFPNQAQNLKPLTWRFIYTIYTITNCSNCFLCSCKRNFWCRKYKKGWNCRNQNNILF